MFLLVALANREKPVAKMPEFWYNYFINNPQGDSDMKTNETNYGFNAGC